MPPHPGPHLAATVLLTLAVLGGGCQSASRGEGILFACEEGGRCSKKDHVCASDGLCWPRATLRDPSKSNIWDLPEEKASSSPAAGASGQAIHTSQPQKGASPGERADARCAKRCAERQADCTADCGEGTKCRQRCGHSADTCQSRCQSTDDARRTARQHRDEKNCMDDGGRPRRCSPAEEQKLRAAMKQASQLLCMDERGEHTLCPEQRQKLEASRRFIPKDCHATGCEGDASE